MDRYSTERTMVNVGIKVVSYFHSSIVKVCFFKLISKKTRAPILSNVVACLFTNVNKTIIYTEQQKLHWAADL